MPPPCKNNLLYPSDRFFYLLDETHESQDRLQQVQEVGTQQSNLQRTYIRYGSKVVMEGESKKMGPVYLTRAVERESCM